MKRKTPIHHGRHDQQSFTKWRVNLQFKWFDLWFGLFIDIKNRCFYLILIPTIVIKIQYEDGLLDEYPKEIFGFKNKKAQEGDVYFVEDCSGVFKTRYISYQLKNNIWKRIYVQT